MAKPLLRLPQGQREKRRRCRTGTHQKKITGHSRVAAKFKAAWKSPSLAAPSPKNTTVQICGGVSHARPATLSGERTSVLPISFCAYAAPLAWGICVASGEEIVWKLSSLLP